MDLASKLLDVLGSEKTNYKPLYELNAGVKQKIEAITKEIYGADGVDYTKSAEKDIASIEKMGLGNLAVCMAKTQYSLSDDPSLMGRPRGFRITVNQVRPSAGAGFLVALTGSIMTMPGLPRHPAAYNMDIDENGRITGLF